VRSVWGKAYGAGQPLGSPPSPSIASYSHLGGSLSCMVQVPRLEGWGFTSAGREDLGGDESFAVGDVSRGYTCKANHNKAMNGQYYIYCHLQIFVHRNFSIACWSVTSCCCHPQQIPELNRCRDSILGSLTMAHFHIQVKSIVLRMQHDTCTINTTFVRRARHRRHLRDLRAP
jgi:hypothetical protein